MPKPERKNSSPVVTRSHFCEASNSSTAESQMKACSLLWGGREEAGGRGEGEEGLRCNSTMIYKHIHGSSTFSLAHHMLCVGQRLPASLWLLWPKRNPTRDRWVRARPPLVPHPTSGYDLKKGAPGLNVSSSSDWSCPCVGRWSGTRESLQ